MNSCKRRSLCLAMGWRSQRMASLMSSAASENGGSEECAGEEAAKDAIAECGGRPGPDVNAPSLTPTSLREFSSSTKPRPMPWSSLARASAAVEGVALPEPRWDPPPAALAVTFPATPTRPRTGNDRACVSMGRADDPGLAAAAMAGEPAVGVTAAETECGESAAAGCSLMLLRACCMRRATPALPESSKQNCNSSSKKKKTETGPKQMSQAPRQDASRLDRNACSRSTWISISGEVCARSKTHS